MSRLTLARIETDIFECSQYCKPRQVARSAWNLRIRDPIKDFLKSSASVCNRLVVMTVSPSSLSQTCGGGGDSVIRRSLSRISTSTVNRVVSIGHYYTRVGCDRNVCRCQSSKKIPVSLYFSFVSSLILYFAFL